jgi:hypothetical protein
MSSNQPSGSLITTPEEMFPDETKAAFLAKISADGYKNKQRLVHEKYVRLQDFLNDPNLKGEDQKDRKIKFEAIQNYEFYDDGNGQKLYRKANGNYERRLVVSGNDAFDILTQMHIKLGHPGRNKYFAGVDQQYYGLKREECDWIKEHCYRCAKDNHLPKQTRLTEGESFESVQVALIDMRHMRSGHYNWILHIMDCISEFSQLYALKNKHAVGIAECLALWIMAFYPMKRVQCDNRKEFKGMC